MTEHETIGEWSDRQDDPLPPGHCMRCGVEWTRCTCVAEPETEDDGV